MHWQEKWRDNVRYHGYYPLPLCCQPPFPSLDMARNPFHLITDQRLSAVFDALSQIVSLNAADGLSVVFQSIKCMWMWRWHGRFCLTGVVTRTVPVVNMAPSVRSHGCPPLINATETPIITQQTMFRPHRIPWYNQVRHIPDIVKLDDYLESASIMLT